MHNRKVCFKHGGASRGAPRGEANGAFKHGGETKEAIALRRSARALLREIADVTA